MITWSNAAGEAIVPHFQFQSKAKSDDTMQLQYDVAEHMPRVVGQFGCEEERSWPVTFDQNEKGGMDEVEFEKYLLNYSSSLSRCKEHVRTSCFTQG